MNTPNKADRKVLTIYGRHDEWNCLDPDLVLKHSVDCHSYRSDSVSHAEA